MKKLAKNSFYKIHYYPDKIWIEVESRKQTIDIEAKHQDIGEAIYQSGLAACKCEELISAVNKKATSGNFRRCKC